MDPGRQVRLARERERYATEAGYDAARYWADRYVEHGITYRTVGDLGKSELDNAKVMDRAMRQFRSWASWSLAQAGRDGVAVDLGCGLGLHLKALDRAGWVHRVGVDLTVAGVEAARQRDPEAAVWQCDIGSQPVRSAGRPLRSAALVCCMDVTQHIVEDGAFEHLLRVNVAGLMPAGGWFICTDALRNVRYSYYERGRDMSAYFNGLPPIQDHVGPVPYRDKFLFAMLLKKST